GPKAPMDLGLRVRDAETGALVTDAGAVRVAAGTLTYREIVLPDEPQDSGGDSPASPADQLRAARVPNLRGMTLEEATGTLAEYGLRTGRVVGDGMAGRVERQSPAANKMVL